MLLFAVDTLGLLAAAGSSLFVLMKRHKTMPRIDRTENISIGSGISTSAMYGAPIPKNLPNALQMPKAVPDNRTGKMYGVET